MPPKKENNSLVTNSSPSMVLMILCCAQYVCTFACIFLNEHVIFSMRMCYSQWACIVLSASIVCERVGCARSAGVVVVNSLGVELDGREDKGRWLSNYHSERWRNWDRDCAFVRSFAWVVKIYLWWFWTEVDSRKVGVRRKVERWNGWVDEEIWMLWRRWVESKRDRDGTLNPKKLVSQSLVTSGLLSRILRRDTFVLGRLMWLRLGSSTEITAYANDAGQLI